MPGLQTNRLAQWIGAGLAVGIGLSLLDAASSQPVVLHLRNGDRVSGSLVTEEAGQIILSNAIVGRMAVPLSQVERKEQATNEAPATNIAGTNAVVASPALARRLNELQALYLANQLSTAEYHRQRAKALAEATQLWTTNRPVAQATKPNGVPAPALVNPGVSAKPPTGPSAPIKPAGPKRWSGEVLMGADLGFSQKDRELYTGRLKVSYAVAPVRNSLDFLFTYGRTDGELSANRVDGSLKSDRDLNRRLYVYNLLGAGYDEIRQIDSRYEFGPGMGEHVLKLTNFVLNAELGFNYQVQNFTRTTNQMQKLRDDQFHYRFGQDLKWLIGSQFTFDEKAEYLPVWNHLAEYRMRVEANLRYWLKANLSLDLTVINIFDTVAAKDVQHNDLQVHSSIGVKF